MRRFYEFDGERPYEERELAHSRLDIVTKQIIKFINRRDKLIRLIDIGVTDGYILRKMVKYNVRCFGLDISFQMLKRLKMHLNSGRYHILYLTQGSITATPFLDNSFDLVTACEIFEHINDEELHFAFKEIKRILRPGGELFITTPYRENVGTSFIKCPGCGIVFPSHGHFQTFDEERWVELAENHDLNIVKIKKIYGTDFRIPRFRFSLPIIKLAARIFSVNSLSKIFVIMSK